MQKNNKRWRIAGYATLSVVVALLGTGTILYRLLMPGLIFLDRLSDPSPEAFEAGDRLLVREVQIQADNRTFSARCYQPAKGYERVVVVVHGVHWGGYEEPRLLSFARKLAGLGYCVVTPDVSDLKNYDIRPRAVDDIERTLLWTLDESDLLPDDSDGKVGLMGISFSGGLGLSAITRPSLRDRIAFALSFGGHADLDRTLQYLCTGLLPDQAELPPHIYGQVVIVRSLAAALVAPEDVERFRELCLLNLRGEEDSVAKRLGEVGPAARDLLEIALERDTKTMGSHLEPILRTRRSDPALSPVRHPPPDCPIFLLHGSVDNVIPPSESRSLARWAGRQTEARILISELVVHVEVEETDGTSFGDYWDLATFITEMLRS